MTSHGLVILAQLLHHGLCDCFSCWMTDYVDDNAIFYAEAVGEPLIKYGAFSSLTLPDSVIADDED